MVVCILGPIVGQWLREGRVCIGGVDAVVVKVKSKASTWGRASTGDYSAIECDGTAAGSRFNWSCRVGKA